MIATVGVYGATLERFLHARADAGVACRHLPELAPTTELRQLQYAIDDAAGVGKRSRVRLAPEYAERYRREILARVDLDEVLDILPSDGIGALMGVERDPEACHRSLIAESLATEYGFEVHHLRR